MERNISISGKNRTALGRRFVVVWDSPAMDAAADELISVCVCHLRVLQLMNLTDSRLAQAGNERLELAMLSFFEQFRKIYIGDQVQKSSKVSTVTTHTLLYFRPET